MSEADGKRNLFTAGTVLDVTGGSLLAGRREDLFTGVSTDSRKIAPGELFLALRGDRFNGNDFIGDALGNGAAGIVTDNGIRGEDVRVGRAVIKVASALGALQALATANRKRHPVPLVAVTGSNGKTTTKEMIAAILSKRYHVLKNEGNLNNHIGVPLTLLKLHSGHDAAVVEMGMNRAGEIRTLAALANPDLGVITNVGEAHLEGLGSIENIKRAKGELLEALGCEDTAVLNADDPAVMELGRAAGMRMITFGIRQAADVSASEIEMEWGKGTLFQLTAGDHTIPVLLPLYGIHQLYNALAASAAATAMGFSLQEIRDALEEYRPYSGRMEIIERGGMLIVNDSYNANPPSVRYAIETISMFKGGRKMAALGDMLELGAEAERIHFDLGRFAAGKGLDRLYAYGPLAARIAAGAVEGGMPRKSVAVFDSREALAERLIGELSCGDCLLVKGSRGMGMDKVTGMLLASLPKGKGGER